MRDLVTFDSWAAKIEIPTFIVADANVDDGKDTISALKLRDAACAWADMTRTPT